MVALTYLNLNYHVTHLFLSQEPAEMGPNDIIIIWAPGKFLLCFLFNSTNIFLGNKLTMGQPMTIPWMSCKTCLCVLSCTATLNTTTPLARKCKVAFVHTHRPHPSCSQTQARGGFFLQHPSPHPSHSQMQARGGFVHPHHHPTPLICKCEPGMGEGGGGGEG